MNVTSKVKPTRKIILFRIVLRITGAPKNLRNIVTTIKTRDRRYFSNNFEEESEGLRFFLKLTTTNEKHKKRMHF